MLSSCPAKETSPEFPLCPQPPYVSISYCNCWFASLSTGRQHCQAKAGASALPPGAPDTHPGSSPLGHWGSGGSSG